LLRSHPWLFPDVRGRTSPEGGRVCH
jgi:hypothetical protein